MNDFITPKNHKAFKALVLSSHIDDEVKDCAIAYIDPRGGGPDPDHTHPHDHLFTVIAGEIEIRMDGETFAVTEGMSLRVPGETRHSVWNTGPTTAKVMGISLRKE